jgi:hypothetical protein
LIALPFAIPPIYFKDESWSTVRVQNAQSKRKLGGERLENMSAPAQAVGKNRSPDATPIN